MCVFRVDISINVTCYTLGTIEYDWRIPELSNVALHMKQDTTSIEKYALKPRHRLRLTCTGVLIAALSARPCSGPRTFASCNRRRLPMIVRTYPCLLAICRCCSCHSLTSGLSRYLLIVDLFINFRVDIFKDWLLLVWWCCAILHVIIEYDRRWPGIASWCTTRYGIWQQ